ncbi:hypothetical protein EDC39_102195 [Geothermobacter ehrlichii]|uniref:Uncharacterized protein n=1 Tax=Geothermobacter ehrlichii TaxID=213224 RepID=A0A5D3WQB6_9BACT|nr:hypothetical protein [Geothermobacter ehrlichii]TYO99670.1 hypothetical protein EDC39_102195 [Geothermobacter ehrlichii]
MRMMIAGPGSTPGAKIILGFFYLYFLLHWATGLLMFHDKLGFSLTGVIRYYLGDPERFMNPRSFSGLLEVTHFHLFAMGLFFVIFTHLLLFTPYADRIKRLLIWLLAATIAGDLAAGWLIRYLSSSFAWLKLASFWGFQLTSLVLLGGLVRNLKPGRCANQPTGSPSSAVRSAGSRLAETPNDG